MEVQLLRRVIVSLFVLCMTMALIYPFGANAGQPVSGSKPESKKTDKPVQIPIKLIDLAVGDTIPDRKLAGLYGGTVKLSSLLRQRSVISFFLPGCELCEKEVSDLVSAARDSTDFQYFIFISSENAARIAKSIPPNRPLLVLGDSGSVYGTLLGVKTIPLNIVVDRSGRIEKITEDAMTLEDYRKIIEFNRAAESKVKLKKSGSK
ncbi:MAG: redoxin domain-containing protein [Candidatus Zixiibacteriota bacterium]|nr:MAG: redoxin domain-containing protein [candidate division Zixibacteria bacterium]